MKKRKLYVQQTMAIRSPPFKSSFDNKKVSCVLETGEEGTRRDKHLKDSKFERK